MVQALSTFTFVLADIPFEVEYRNVKTLRLTVYPPDGRVKISAPPGAAPGGAEILPSPKLSGSKSTAKGF